MSRTLSLPPQSESESDVRVTPLGAATDVGADTLRMVDEINLRCERSNTQLAPVQEEEDSTAHHHDGGQSGGTIGLLYL